MRSAAAAYAGAAFLLSVYMLGLDPLVRALRPLMAGIPGLPVLADVVSLVIVAVAVLALRGARSSPLLTRPSHGSDRRQVAAAAFLALALLGVAALALRLLDPGFDEREFALRGLGDPRAFRRLLLLVPFIVVAEEVVFRTCQDWVRPALGSAVSCGATASAFALHHMELGGGFTAHDAVTLLATIVGGLVLAGLYETAPSVALVLAVHLAYDFLALTQAWLSVNGPVAGETALFTTWILVSGLAGWRLGWGRGWRSPRNQVEEPPAGRLVQVVAAVAFGIALPGLMSILRSFL